MRVIAGKYKGKRLFSPIDQKVRPTSDRIKETIFNILNSKGVLADAAVLDLFAGSGALGIEALSRGANFVVFADASFQSVKLIEKNLEVVGAKCEVFLADFTLALKKLQGKKFDLILVDPPYAMQYEPIILQFIEKYALLNEDGIIFIEHSKENSLINLDKSYIIDTRCCKNTHISFLQKIK